VTTPSTTDARAIFASLKEGDRVQVTQQVRVGSRTWSTATSGTVKKTERIVTGLHVDRAKDDRVFADTILLERDGNRELTTVSLDENTRLEVLSGGKGIPNP